MMILISFDFLVGRERLGEKLAVVRLMAHLFVSASINMFFVFFLDQVISIASPVNFVMMSGNKMSVSN